MSKYSHLFNSKYIYGIRSPEGELNWCSDEDRFISDMYDNDDMSYVNCLSRKYTLEKIISLDEDANVTIIFNRETDFNPMPKFEIGDIIIRQGTNLFGMTAGVYTGAIIIYPEGYDMPYIPAKTSENGYGVVAIYRFDDGISRCGLDLERLKEFPECLIWHNKFYDI